MTPAQLAGLAEVHAGEEGEGDYRGPGQAAGLPAGFDANTLATQALRAAGR